MSRESSGRILAALILLPAISLQWVVLDQRRSRSAALDHRSEKPTMVVRKGFGPSGRRVPRLILVHGGPVMCESFC